MIETTSAKPAAAWIWRNQKSRLRADSPEVASSVTSRKTCLASSMIGRALMSARVASGVPFQAIAQLPVTPKLAVIDGNRAPTLNCPSRTIVKGDARCLSIAAASIIAKVTRDRLMIKLARDMPGYGFERHKGYGTAEHQAAIKRLGVTVHHRRSFRTVQLALGLMLENTPAE